jgi:hypothetical protein
VSGDLDFDFGRAYGWVLGIAGILAALGCLVFAWLKADEHLALAGWFLILAVVNGFLGIDIIRDLRKGSPASEVTVEEEAGAKP